MRPQSQVGFHGFKVYPNERPLGAPTL